MPFVSHLTCVSCGATYKEGEASTCPTCGPAEGILDVKFDLQAVKKLLTWEAIRSRPFDHWRYLELIPVNDAPPPRPQHIGGTPLIHAPRLADAVGVKSLRLKDETRSASGSFKDRASAIGVARALAEGAKAVACASTGNAAISLAHCAAAVGLPCYIFVGQRIPEGKLVQLLACGAHVFKVLGTYDQAYRLCSEACRKYGWYDRNAAVNPYLVEGKKTGGLELAEQCADDPPDWVAVSVGDGCTIAGIEKGLRQMREIGLIDWTTKLLGVQAEGVAPIAAAFEGKGLLTTGDTYADSINCPVPRNWRKAVEAVRRSGGTYVAVSDREIQTAVRETGRMTGIFAEPAAATAVAGIAAARRLGIVPTGQTAVAMITGNGLKDVAGALQALGKATELEPNPDALARALRRGESY